MKYNPRELLQLNIHIENIAELVSEDHIDDGKALIKELKAMLEMIVEPSTSKPQRAPGTPENLQQPILPTSRNFYGGPLPSSIGVAPFPPAGGRQEQFRDTPQLNRLFSRISALVFGGRQVDEKGTPAGRDSGYFGSSPPRNAGSDRSPSRGRQRTRSQPRDNVQIFPDCTDDTAFDFYKDLLPQNLRLEMDAYRTDHSTT